MCGNFYKGELFMKAIKDFLYDKNDILIALLILVIAGLLIAWRMDVIMAYPQTLAEATGTQDTTNASALDAEKEDAAKSESKDNQNENADKNEDSIWVDGALKSSVTVTIAGGSATAAVQSLIDQGLFTSYAEFEQVCKAAGYTPENIKATTFTFDAGSTQTDIARKVTQ